MVAFKSGTVTAAEFLDRKGQCTSTHLALLVASPEFRRHQPKKQSDAHQGFLFLVAPALLLMFAILLAELLRPVGMVRVWFSLLGYAYSGTLKCLISYVFAPV